MSLNLQHQAKKSNGEKSSLSKLCNFSKESASFIQDTASIDINTSPPRPTYHFVPVYIVMYPVSKRDQPISFTWALATCLATFFLKRFSTFSGEGSEGSCNMMVNFHVQALGFFEAENQRNREECLN